LRKFLHWLSQLGLAEKKQSRVARGLRATITGRLRGNIGHVYAFAEHVTIHRRFGWGDAKALREDTTEVGGSGSMPEKPTVAIVDFSVRRI
jgi:hypothetical protein